MTQNCVTKKCFKCLIVKPLNEFYSHKGMLDKHLGKCKECTKWDVKTQAHTPKGALRIMLYERARAKLPHRLALFESYKRRNPEKQRARHAVTNAIRDGRLKRLPCEKCGKPNGEAHHTDYSKPLDVMWLCHLHHKEIEGKIPYLIQINKI